MAQEQTICAQSSIEIGADIDRVWRTIAEDFDAIGQWSTSVVASKAILVEDGAENAPVGGRFCEIAAAGFSDTSEKILEFQPKEYISYELFEGLPGFVVEAINSWTLTDADGRTKLEGRTDMRVKGLMGRLMAGFMKRALLKALNGMSHEVKVFIETGQPVPKKLKMLAKA